MTNRIAGSKTTKGALASLFALSAICAAIAGCAADSTGKSGETHFLCSKDDDCTRHFGSDDYSCGSSKYCVLNTDAGAGGSGGSGGSANGGSGGKAGGGSGGSAGGNGGAGQCMPSSTSTCTPTDLCKTLGCPSLQYDEHGCLRPQCKTDDECSADERCAVSQCDSPTTCTKENGDCVCSSLAICGQVPRCNPTSTTGARGAWVDLVVTFTQSLCAGPSGVCVTTWHVAPDGHVTGTKSDPNLPDGGAPIDAMLDIAQMFELVNWVNGTDLRLALRDGIPCVKQGATDIGLEVDLELSTQTLKSGEVNGCTAPDNVYGQIYDLLRRATQ